MISGRSDKQIKRVLLVSTNCFKDPSPVFPLALSYLSATIKKKFTEIETKLFDFNLKSKGQLRSFLQEFQPDLIGISIRNIDTVNYFDDRHFIEENRLLIKEIRESSESFIVLGGAGFSIFPEIIFERLEPDFGIFGEGEESLSRLIETINKNEDFSQIRGLIFNETGKTIFNRRNTFLSETDLSFDKELIDYCWREAGTLNIQTKRGCPYQCVYCTYPLIEGRKVRTNNPKRIVDRMVSLYHDHGVNYFFFTDSVFNIDNEYNCELAKRIISSKMEIRWGAYFSPHHLSESHLKLLRQSGLTHIEFGTESLSNSTLNSYNKNFDVEDVVASSNSATKLGVHTAHFLILGGCGETEASINETLENSDRFERTVFFPYFGMRIYPGTRLREIAVKEGKIKEDDDLITPTFYHADNMDYDSIKKRAGSSRNRWIFPDRDLSKPIQMMRAKGIKGPLWEMLIK